MLDDDLVERILEDAIALLGRTGIRIEEPSSFARLKASGFEPREGDWLTIPRKLIEQAIASAPSSFTLYDREGEPSATLEGDEVHFVPASSALRVLDHRSQQVRIPTTADFVEYVKIADALPHLSYLSTAFVPDDIPQEMADSWRLYLSLSHSRQPVVTGAFTAWGVERFGRILCLFRSGRDELVAKPLAILTCCPTTPLRWGEDPIRNLIDCAEWGIPTEIVPVLLLGMISPATPVGALVLHTAEVLSGITVTQMIRPGAPVLFGGAPATFHMRYMTNPMTAVEALQVYCAYAQIAKRLELPCQAYMALSDSKANDPQAGAESAVGAYLAALAGINSVSGPGMLDYVNIFSLEKLVFDDEIVAHAQRFVREVEVKDDLPSEALIDELVSENHLLMAEHTLEHWPKEFLMPGPVTDRTNWEQWEQAGSENHHERALSRIESILSDYDQEPLDRALHDEIRDLFLSTSLEENVTLPSFDS